MKYFTEMAAIITLTSNLVGGIGFEPTSNVEKDVFVQYPLAQQKFVIESNGESNQYEIFKNTLKQLEEQQAREEFEKQMVIEAQIAFEKQQVVEKQQTEFTDFVNTVRYNDTTKIDLRKPSGLTTELANEVLEGTGLDGLGEAFVNSEDKYGVNAYYLMAHAAWESEWGKSRLSQTKNNLFGFQAYDNDPYNKARHFNSKEESIDVVANYVSKHYLSSNGDHYNGSTLQGMNIKYASDTAWAKGIGSIMDKFAMKLAKTKGV